MFESNGQTAEPTPQPLLQYRRMSGLDFQHSGSKCAAMLANGVVEEASDEECDESTDEEEGGSPKKEKKRPLKAASIMRKQDFFQALEASSPGFINALAQATFFASEREGQVMFRQGEAPLNCYVLTHGKMCVLIHKAAPKDDADQPSPKKRRGSSVGQDEERCPSPRTHSMPDWCPTYTDAMNRQKASFYGNLVMELGVGTIFGELALKNSNPRAATIMCQEDCEVLVINAETFKSVVQDWLDKTRVAHEAWFCFRNVPFFDKLEEDSPGIVRALAVGVTLHTEMAQQVLFRQHDPPGNCYILQKGEIGENVFKDQRASGVQLKKSELPTPRDFHPTQGLTTMSVAQGTWQKRRDKEIKMDHKKHEQEVAAGVAKEFHVWSKADMRYQTTEGFSTFSKNSKYGDRVMVLESGAVFGELALQNDEPRAVTTTCLQDCTFLVISKDIFQQVLGDIMAKIRFFNVNLPGLDRMEHKQQTHPSTMFHKRCFPEGYTFFTEGIGSAEPAVFLVFSGTIEFRRYRRADENPVYRQITRPLGDSWRPSTSIAVASRPASKSLKGPGSPDQKPASTAAQRPDSPSKRPVSPSRSHTVPRLQPPVAHKAPAGTHSIAAGRRSSVVGAREKSYWNQPKTFRLNGQDAIDTAESGAVFCSLPFFPCQTAEPFTVVAVTAVEAFHCGSQRDVDQIPANICKVLRTTLLKAMTERMRVFSEKQMPLPPVETLNGWRDPAANAWPSSAAKWSSGSLGARG
ncbi:unnamed protein product [Polarella glacialis]|uniref:Cyclic nucleotide-binding domain-containing protein n=1 Tax=Polarella glacialis TaxID=89957 RepID=A0A813F5E8_POLGL|nr:unnamed protein product [Polarella glacialis]